MWLLKVFTWMLDLHIPITFQILRQLLSFPGVSGGRLHSFMLGWLVNVHIFPFPKASTQVLLSSSHTLYILDGFQATMAIILDGKETWELIESINLQFLFMMSLRLEDLGMQKKVSFQSMM